MNFEMQCLFSLLLQLACVLLSGQVVLANDETVDDNLIVAGYLPEYRAYINVNVSMELLTDLYLFSIGPGEDGSIEGDDVCCVRNIHYRTVKKAMAHAPNVRVWLTIGGSGRSHHFAEIVADEPSRKDFLLGLKKLCDKYDFAGIDFDWEVPSTKEEVRGFYKMLKEASTILHDKDDDGNIRKRRMVSVALHPNMFISSKVYPYLDRIHLMAYDLQPPEKGRRYHAGFSAVEKAARDFLERGCPPEKLILGIPLYARHRDDFGDVKTFSEIADMAGPKTILQSKSYKGYEFESQESLRKKLDFVKQEKLGGIFYWEIGQDKQDAEYGPGGVFMTSVLKMLNPIEEREQEGLPDEL